MMLRGLVVTGKYRLHQFDPEFLDDEQSSFSPMQRAITLADHSQGVAAYACRFAIGCGLDPDTFTQAGLFHDLGKLDPRFQAMLKGSSPSTAVGEPWAKSVKAPRSRAEREQAREVHRYPRGARHELLSAAILAEKTNDDLLLHLIATHHGSGRPFADTVEENAFARSFQVELFNTIFPTSKQDIAAWNAELPERFWRVVRKLGWWGSAYHEAAFRLADHAQSRAEQEADYTPKSNDAKSIALLPMAPRPRLFPLPLPGLDGANPLAFLAALGTLAICDRLARRHDRPNWLAAPPQLAWGADDSELTPVLYFNDASPTDDEFSNFLAGHLERNIEDHPSSWVVRMLDLGLPRDAIRDFQLIRTRMLPPNPIDRLNFDWVTALSCESAIDADSQLQTVRCDYLVGNLRSLMKLATADHIRRTLFENWDFADGLANQSLHWEPTEDRRHAYQWHMPSCDPTRMRLGGMLGANRLALEAWPLMPSFPAKERGRVKTRGFQGHHIKNTFWTWPLWEPRFSRDAVASILGVPVLQRDTSDIERRAIRSLGIRQAFRSQRILVGKTPNLTAAIAIG